MGYRAEARTDVGGSRGTTARRCDLLLVYATALHPGFTAVLRIAVEITVSGDAEDHAASAAEAGTLAVLRSARDAARAAVLGIMGQYSLACVGGVAITVGTARRTIL